MTVVEHGPVMLITYKQLTANSYAPLLTYLISRSTCQSLKVSIYLANFQVGLDLNYSGEVINLRRMTQDENERKREM
jgi:hypothetical protein